jgi:hypothetical protein
MWESNSYGFAILPKRCEICKRWVWWEIWDAFFHRCDDCIKKSYLKHKEYSKYAENYRTEKRKYLNGLEKEYKEDMKKLEVIKRKKIYGGVS